MATKTTTRVDGLLRDSSRSMSNSEKSDNSNSFDEGDVDGVDVDDDNEYDNALIIDNLFTHTQLLNTSDVNEVLDRTYKRVQRETEQNFDSMKQTLQLAKSQYTQSNINNTSFGDDVDGDNLDPDNLNLLGIEIETESENSRSFAGTKDKDILDSRTKKRAMSTDSESKATLNTLQSSAKSFDEADLNDSKRFKAKVTAKIKAKKKSLQIQQQADKNKEKEKAKANKANPKEKIVEKNQKNSKLKQEKSTKKLKQAKGKAKGKKDDYNKKSGPPVPPPKGTEGTSEADRAAETNLQFRTWSVASFDSCGGDTRRNYAAYLLTNKRKKIKERVQNTLAFFKSSGDAMFSIPKHAPSEYEDSQPYGPLDEDHPYFLELMNNKKAGLLSATISRISGKSVGAITNKSPRNAMSTGSGSGRGRGTSVSGNLSSKVSTIGKGVSGGGKLLNRFFTGRKSRAGSEMQDIESALASMDNRNNKSFPGDRVEKTKGETMTQVMQLTKQKMNQLNANSQMESNKTGNENEIRNLDEGVINKAPRYIPPDMEWDEKFNEGKGGLVNKVPKYIPKGLMWSRSANRGLGALINIPPPAGALPPGKIWSRTANNGMGGVVNMPPQKMPKGMMWDYEASGGKGAMVSAAKLKMKLKNSSAKSDGKKGYKVSVARYTNETNDEEEDAAKTKMKKDVVSPSPAEIVPVTEKEQDNEQTTTKSRRNYVSKTIKGKKTPRSERDVEVLDEPEGVETAAETAPPVQSVNDEETESQAAQLKLRAEELRQLEEKLRRREDELKQRETTLTKKESEIRMKEIELESRATALMEDTASERSEHSIGVKVAVKSPARKKNTQSSYPSDRKLWRKTQGSSSDKVENNRGKYSKHPSSADSADEARKVKRSSRLLQLRKSVSDARSSVIMEEAGIEPGHVLKMFECFERISSSSSSEEPYYD